jgi:hypothetical protein
MGLTQTIDGRNADGTPHIHNEWTPLEGQTETHVVQTGPVRGLVILDDGTKYDVSPDHIQVSGPAHRDAVCFHIAKMHEASGQLTDIVHGPGNDGPRVIVVGTESDYHLAHADAPDVAL